MEGLFITPADIKAHDYGNLKKFHSFTKDTTIVLPSGKYTALLLQKASCDIIPEAPEVTGDLSLPFHSIANGQQIDVEVCWVMLY